MKNPFLLFAEVPVCTQPGQTGCVNIPTQTGSDLLTNGLNIVYFVLGAVAIVVIIFAGYQYLTANGEPDKAKKAMHTILYAIIGLVVVISAFAITNFVAGRV